MLGYFFLDSVWGKSDLVRDPYLFSTRDGNVKSSQAHQNTLGSHVFQ